MRLTSIEEIRTKQELLNYFKQKGKSTTQREIETLKQIYKQAQKGSNTLSLYKLGNIIGGVKFTYKLANISSDIYKPYGNTNYEYYIPKNFFRAIYIAEKSTPILGQKLIIKVEQNNSTPVEKVEHSIDDLISYHIISCSINSGLVENTVRSILKFFPRETLQKISKEMPHVYTWINKVG